MSFAPPPKASHHCRHYSYERGMNWSGPKCACEIDLTAPKATEPCMPEGTGCDWREEHTEEERAAWHKWREERMERMTKILLQIPGSSRDKKNKPEWGKRGEFPCPACEVGTVRWARASINGHLHAACTTDGCFGVME
jgi:hypothetical protein